MDKRKSKVVKVIPWLMCAVGFVLLVYAGYMLILQIMDYSKSEELYESINEEYVSVSEPINDEATEKLTDWTTFADVDISQFREINEDIAGWIYFENDDISYPVLYSKDNSKYLRRTYTGESLSAGSIFIEGKNNRDFSDAHTIIYGHNMKDSSMFGKLEDYVTKKDYIIDHEFFQIITENEKYRYRIISYKIVGDSDEIYTVYQSGNQKFVDFVKEHIQGGSFVESDCEVNTDDHLITLSTCFNDNRLVISAIRCDESIKY